MRPKSSSAKKPAEQVVKDIRRATRRHFSAEDKIRIVLEGLRGDDSIAELCRREGICRVEGMIIQSSPVMGDFSPEIAAATRELN